MFVEHFSFHCRETNVCCSDSKKKKQLMQHNSCSLLLTHVKKMYKIATYYLYSFCMPSLHTLKKIASRQLLHFLCFYFSVFLQLCLRYARDASLKVWQGQVVFSDWKKEQKNWKKPLLVPYRGVQFLFVIRTWCIQVQNHSVLAPWKTLRFF